MKIDITELNVIDLKPGQVLVATIETQYHTSMGYIQESLKKMFPNNTVLVKTTGMTFEVIGGDDNGKAQSQYR